MSGNRTAGRPVRSMSGNRSAGSGHHSWGTPSVALPAAGGGANPPVNVADASDAGAPHRPREGPPAPDDTGRTSDTACATPPSTEDEGAVVLLHPPRASLPPMEEGGAAPALPHPPCDVNAMAGGAQLPPPMEEGGGALPPHPPCVDGGAQLPPPTKEGGGALPPHPPCVDGGAQLLLPAEGGVISWARVSELTWSATACSSRSRSSPGSRRLPPYLLWVLPGVWRLPLPPRRDPRPPPWVLPGPKRIPPPPCLLPPPRALPGSRNWS